MVVVLLVLGINNNQAASQYSLNSTEGLVQPRSQKIGQNQ
jgi:hypothetical protein